MKLITIALVSLTLTVAIHAREYRLTEVSVYDGDTVIGNLHLGLGVALYQTRIRLAGINTPETKTLFKLEKKAGKLVTLWLTEKVKAGKEFLLVTNDKKERGSFKRPMGVLFIDGVDMCDLLLQKHFAKVFHAKKKKSWFLSELTDIIQWFSNGQNIE